MRILINVLTVGIIVACGFAIYFAQEFSTQVKCNYFYQYHVIVTGLPFLVKYVGATF